MSLICSYSTGLRLSFHYKTRQCTSRLHITAFVLSWWDLQCQVHFFLRDLIKLIHKCTRSYSTTTQHDIDVTRLRSDLWWRSKTPRPDTAIWRTTIVRCILYCLLREQPGISVLMFVRILGIPSLAGQAVQSGTNSPIVLRIEIQFHTKLCAWNLKTTHYRHMSEIIQLMYTLYFVVKIKKYGLHIAPIDISGCVILAVHMRGGHSHHTISLRN